MTGQPLRTSWIEGIGSDRAATGRAIFALMPRPLTVHECGLSVVMIAIAIVIAVGHFCASSTDDHSVMDGQGGTDAGHHETADPSSRDGGSCEAAVAKAPGRVAWPPAVFLALLHWVVGSTPALPSWSSAVHVRSAPLFFGPPLFLRHATLLI